MSMLAERKIKQKWSLNPRGTAWSEDSSKFGQKMLEKMGWSKGKGLGAKEDGIVANLKVSYKNDSKGMGYKERDDQWTEHDANFNALLANLSGADTQVQGPKIASLEKKSQSSRVRVHYTKFTRGKDLSRRSEKDLANIFGKKALGVPKVEEEVQEVAKSDNWTRNSGSMVDYFKKKLSNYGKNGSYVVGSNGVLKKDEDSEEEGRPGFGFMSSRSDSEEEGRGLGFGKKRKSGGDVMNGTPKKVRSEESEEKGLSNPSFDPLFGKVEVQKHILNTIEEEEHNDAEEERSFQEKKENIENPSFNENSYNDNCEVKKKEKILTPVDNLNFHINPDNQNSFNSGDIEVKRKKKKQKKNGDVQTDGNNFGSEIEDQSHQNNECDVKRKKKRNVESDLAIDNPNFDDENQDHSCQNDEFEVKRKKKNERDLAIDNPNFDDNIECQSFQNNGFEVKRKNKKKKGENGSGLTISNPTFDEKNEDHSCHNNNGFEVIRKKKNESDLPADNPNFDDHNEDQSWQNNEFEVKTKKKKKKGENASDLPADNPIFEDKSNEYEVKRKKKKNGNDSLALDNPNFDDKSEDQSYQSNEFEVKRKKKKKNGNDSLALDNPNFDAQSEDHSYQSNEFEVKRKTNRNDSLALDNPNFDAQSEDHSYQCNEFEVKRKKKKKSEDSSAVDTFGNCQNGFVVPNFEVKKTKTEENESSFDLILNVSSTPSVSSTKSSIRRRKSVRFSEDVENRNDLFDINTLVIENGLKSGNDSRNLDLENNLDEFSKKIDGFQAEIENDINEAKVTRFVGEVGDPDGENEKLPDGTKLKFKYANFRRTPSYLYKDTSRAKSSYKHLIKGDIIVCFKNTNLHEIAGYGATKN